MTAADWYYSKGSGKGKKQIMFPSQSLKHVFSVFFFNQAFILYLFLGMHKPSGGTSTY